MSDRMVEGVIYCATHGKPLGECRHPVLEGEVSDGSKPVSQQQRARGGHMRAFVTQERIDSAPSNGGIRGEGVTDAWARQNQLPIVRLLPLPPPPYPSLYESARRELAEFDRAWTEENTRVPRDPLATAYPTQDWNPTVLKVSTGRVTERHNQWHRWDHVYEPWPGWQCRDCPEFVTVADVAGFWGTYDTPNGLARALDMIVTRRNVRTDFVTTLEQEIRNRSDGLVDVRDRAVVMGADGEVDEALTARYHASKAEGLRLSREEQLRMLREVGDIAQAPHGPPGHVPAGLALEREILGEIHRRMDDLHVSPFDLETHAARSVRMGEVAAELHAAGAYRLAEYENPADPDDIGPFTQPKRWSWGWWCREWRFLTLRLRWWAIKRLRGDA